VITVRSWEPDASHLLQTNNYLFMANSDFPLMLRRGVGGIWDSNLDVVEVRLDCPVSAELFTAPNNLKPTRPFNIPAVPLEIEVRQTRQSRQWGWTEVITNTFSTDGKIVTNHHGRVYCDANGKQHHGASVEVKPFGQGLQPLNYPLNPPSWRTARKIGEDSILGMKAEVYEQAALGRRYWLVDHPMLGTFSAKWFVGGDMPETNEVLRLEIRPY
jgi:hypothetical protein